MLSVLHELSRIGEGGKEYVSPMSEEEEEEKERGRRKYTPEQGKSILPAAYALFVFFLSFLLLCFVCERNKKVKTKQEGSKQEGNE